MAETPKESGFHRRREKIITKEKADRAIEARKKEKQRSRRFNELSKILVGKGPFRNS